MFNYIKFGMFLMSYQEAPGVGGEVSNASNEQKINPEQTKKELSELDQKILELKTQLLDTKAGTKIVGQRTGILEKRSSEDISMGELREPGAVGINDEVIRLKGEVWRLEQRKQVLERTIEVTKDNKLSVDEVSKMKTMSNKEFLKYPANERLRFVTIGNVENKDVKEGGTTSMEFTFTYDGEFNRDLYVRTTAGQVLNESVRVVESGGVEYTRRGYNGEFFAENGKRLLIHEGTKVDVKKFGTEEELKASLDSFDSAISSFKGTPNEDFALETLKKGYDPKFILGVFGDRLKGLEGNARSVEIEDILSDIARLEDDFSDDFPGEKIEKDGKITEKFAGYVVNTMVLKEDSKNNILEQISKDYGFDLESMKSTRRQNNPMLGGGPINMENISINIDKDYPNGVESLLHKKEYRPGTKDAVMLFLVAAQAAGFPLDWCKKESLHRLLTRESNGVVGRLNYTITRESPDSFKEKAVSSSSKNPIGSVSTASGLGQMLLSNVDKYYPDGRSGIGDPLNEAVGMLRYIKDRYGDPDIAWSVYGKTGSYVHPDKGPQTKSFREGY